MTAKNIILAIYGQGAWVDDHPAPILPCKHRDKVPLVAWKPYQETPPTVKQVKAWQKQYNQCNWALMTGGVSGIVVLDVDNYDVASHWWRQQVIKEPTTAMVETSTGKYHYYFRWPGFSVRNFAKKIPGMDFRGDGGYVIAPGSTHHSGIKYQWVHGMGPDMQEFAPCPDWLLAELSEQRTDLAQPIPQGAEVITVSALGKDYDIPLSEYELRMMDSLAAGCAEGSRNDSGFRIGLWLLDGGQRYDDLGLILRSWNTRNNPRLEEKELNKLIDSIYTYWTRKKNQDDDRKASQTTEGREVLRERLSRFLGVEIHDVYQMPDDEKAIYIVATHHKWGKVTSKHIKITGYKAWASEFSQQTLIVPHLPEKISTKFGNDFLVLLYGSARVKEAPREISKVGQVRKALELIQEDTRTARSRDDSMLAIDGRGRNYFTAFIENETLYFHIYQFKQVLETIANDLLWDREITKLLDEVGAQQKRINMFESRMTAWTLPY